MGKSSQLQRGVFGTIGMLLDKWTRQTGESDSNGSSEVR